MADEARKTGEMIYPLDSSRSTKEDEESLMNLKKALELQIDPVAGEMQREEKKEILEELQCKIIEWSEQIVEKNLHTDNKPLKVRQMMKQQHVQIVEFGSYALNVNHTDIDMLCYTSRHVSREEFFETVFQKLKNDDAVNQPQKLVDAYVPLLKFTYRDLDIDLVFAALPKEDLNDIDIHDDELLEEMSSNAQEKDEKDLLSLNGARVTRFLQKRVQDNIAFDVGLQTVKTWARERGIYSSVMGYLGGVSWAILVTKICQLFPNANAATVVRKFFFFYSRWRFGPERPISLLPASEQKKRSCSDPSRQDERPLMQIVTPVNPTMNTSYNVTKATFRLMVNEFKRGDQILNPESGESVLTEEMWRDFFAPSRFFFNHANYLLIKMGAQGGETNVFLWTNFIRTKIRNFIQTIERTTGSKATPFPQCIKSPEGKSYFAIGIDINEESLSGSRKVNLARAVKQFVDVIYNRPSSRPYRTLNAQLYVFRKRRRELPEWVFTTDERPADWEQPAEAGEVPQTTYQNYMLPPNALPSSYQSYV